ncbi:Tryptophan--tRNA ligase, mitochondrial [Steccherinum ochraceum]|uniref:tryptophan--tRNA ligase n=1 Tax=Steccherinum ochraceum TaxID=92696 RepID=A0A4R0RCG6_9APHY|nr:Tryptophan--tRNA ligase, mitochondrial [Steccherinum ochraceum]
MLATTSRPFARCTLHVPRNILKNVPGSLRRLSQAQAAHRPRIVFSGIQPTGIPHLGNYLGALLNWVRLQQDAGPEDRLIFSIVGWHALTLPQNPRELSNARRDALAVLLAIGIDPKRSILFHQDENPHHTELSWLFNCLTPVGKLRRMTTWKSRLAVSRNANDESEVDESLLNAGLLTYPVLQAADILAYKATHVPVGEDQKQHLELARDIADTFNRTFKGKSRLFPLPEFVATPTRRVLSLKDPTSKMSKSSPDVQSRILLTDSTAQIKSKIRGAVTDPIADAVEELLRGPRAEFEKLKGEAQYLSDVARAGAAKARERSEITMQETAQVLVVVSNAAEAVTWRMCA